MFIWSVKTSKRELIILAVGILVFIAAVCYVVWPRGAARTSAMVKDGYSVLASTEDERAKFLTQFGWNFDSTPLEVKEIIVPVNFDDVYKEYNEIQKAQGFNLEWYRGERLKRWTYLVTNYPGVSDTIVANLLVKDGKVVGGDICSTALDGFMHGFDPEKYAEEMIKQASANANSEVEQNRILDGEIPENEDAKPEED
ncbi:MAG: DUF4830 domain-containing protein [Oscillospiraceae bacterium]|jgi:hypothetical protein|nr:DUF4830 domain-containing protein [Oscillospiraceae bacterium]